MQAGFRALRQWRDLREAGSDEAYKRQLAAADAARVHTHVTNALGVAAELQLDFGDHVYALPHLAVLVVSVLSTAQRFTLVGSAIPFRGLSRPVAWQVKWRHAFWSRCSEVA